MDELNPTNSTAVPIKASQLLSQPLLTPQNTPALSLTPTCLTWDCPGTPMPCSHFHIQRHKCVSMSFKTASRTRTENFNATKLEFQCGSVTVSGYKVSKSTSLYCHSLSLSANSSQHCPSQRAKQSTQGLSSLCSL